MGRITTPQPTRDYGLFPIICTSMMIMVTWETLLYTISFTLSGGGPTGAFFAYLLVWLGKASIFTTLGEIASMAPHPAGQPYWVGLLAEPQWRKAASYITAWIQLLGWIALTTSGVYMAGMAIVIIVEFADAGYEMPRWLMLLVFWAGLVVSLASNVLVGSKLRRVGQVVLAMVHILTLFAMLVPALYWSVGDNAGEIWTTFVNDSGWNSNFLGFMLSSLGPAYSFCGCDAPVFLSEEAKIPERAVPQAMLMTVLIDGLVGLAALVVFLACDIGQSNNSSWKPGIQSWDGLGQFIGGQYGGFSLGIIMAICLATAFTYWFGMAARFLWLVAQVNGIPGSRYLKQIESRYTRIPLFAFLTIGTICAVFVIGLDWSLDVWRGCLCLAVVAIDLPTFICNCLLLRQRLSGKVMPSGKVSADASDEKVLIVWGNWRLKEPWGTMNNVLACVIHGLIILFNSWPSSPNMPKGLSYSPFVILIVTAISAVYYRCWARKEYVGYRDRPESTTTMRSG